MRQTIIPPRPQPGQYFRAVAPAHAMSRYKTEVLYRARDLFRTVGSDLVFPDQMPEGNLRKSTSIAFRVEELHQAYRDPQCAGIISVAGGANSLELARYLDWNLIISNPKIFIGTSDISALVMAIWAMTDQVAYYGPGVYKLGTDFGAQAMFDALWRCVSTEDPYEVASIGRYVEDVYEGDPKLCKPLSHPGYHALQEGAASGVVTGGNIRTLTRSVRRSIMGQVDDTILFYESSGATLYTDMTTDLGLIIESAHDPSTIRGLVLGTMAEKSGFGEGYEYARAMLHGLHEWGLSKDVPVVWGAPFGHISSDEGLLTIPVGGECEITASSTGCQIRITKH